MIVGLTTSACGGNRSSTGQTAQSASAGATSSSIAPTAPAELFREVRRPGARATLVNVWASWCGPCREEFPDLLRLEREYRPKGLRTMLVSVDFDSADAKKFLAAQRVRFPTYLKIGDDTAFINGLSPKWSGALPATFMYDSTGRLVGFWEGRADYQKFKEATLEAMSSTGPTP